jgi:YVTN family beta-propeller protein
MPRNERLLAVLVLGIAYLGLSVPCLAVDAQAPGKTGADAERQGADRPALRRPVALALGAGERLYCANARSGTISVIDLQRARVRDELAVGEEISDIALASGRILALDEARNQLIVLDTAGRPMSSIPVPRAPVSLCVSADGSVAFVTSLWAHSVSRVLLSGRGGGPPVETIGLPFAPRCQFLFSDRNVLIVADNFAGKVGVVDLRQWKLIGVRELPAHNIRGMCASGNQLVLAHQRLNPEAQTTFEDVHWGNLITNNLRFLSVERLLEPGDDVLKDGSLYYLGEVGQAAGDPSAVARTSDGTLLVCLGGVDQVAIKGPRDSAWARLASGARPGAMVLSADGRRAFVGNTLDDTISVIDIKGRKAVSRIALGSQPPLSAADRGERLFYSSRLTHDGWYSCQSCHTDGHSNGQLNDNFSDGSFGTPKRVLSLRGVRDTAPYAWLGTVPDLESQIRKSIQVTMQGTKPAEKTVSDLAAYLRTLNPAPAVDADKKDQPIVLRGATVFQEQGCVRCHTAPYYTTPKTYDVGFKDEAGQTRFNPPSLRGVSQTGPYFHDGRAATLEDVFGRYRHQLKTDLTGDEIAALVAYLRRL